MVKGLKDKEKLGEGFIIYMELEKMDLILFQIN